MTASIHQSVRIISLFVGQNGNVDFYGTSPSGISKVQQYQITLHSPVGLPIWVHV